MGAQDAMNFISLFSGIGGFDLGFERAGMTCDAVCEIDKNAQNMLRRHFPHAKLFDDVHKIGKETHGRKSIDLICGGFPCQDLSLAGKRAGLAGERSGLWFEFARVVDELEPQWVVVENVPGLLSSNKGRDFAVIIQWLVKRGYGVAWRVLDAQYFGVPQRRRRVFIVASLGDGRAAEVLFESDSGTGNTESGRKAGEEVAFTLRANSSHNGSGDGAFVAWPSRLIAQSLTGANTQNNGGGGITDRSTPTLIVMAHGQANAEVVSDGEPSLTRNREAPILFDARNGVETGNVSMTLQAGAGHHGYSVNATPLLRLGGVRRLMPIECERLQGFPDGWTDGQSDSARYRQLGNAVAVPVAEWIGKRIMEVSRRLIPQPAPQCAHMTT